MSTLQYNIMVPHISRSRLHHGTQVCYFGMAHSLICTMPYPHLATYMAITLRARYGAHSHNITSIYLGYTKMLLLNASVSPILARVCIHYSVTLWYPHISPSRLHHGTRYLTLVYGSFSHIRHILLPHSSLRAHSPT